MNSLPIVALPTYPFCLPSTGKVIQFRPYTVGEEKILLTALESEDFNQITGAISQIIKACTDGAVKPSELTLYDFELLFLNIKAKASGEKLSVNLINRACLKKEGKSPCDKASEFVVDLDELKATINDQPYDPSKRKDIIKITDDIGVQMRHPSLDDLKLGNVLFDKNADSMTELEKLRQTKDLQDSLIASCMVSVYHGDSIVHTKDISIEDRVKWIGSLHEQAKRKLEEYFDNVPVIRHKIEFKCNYCDYKTDHVLEGIKSFFE